MIAVIKRQKSIIKLIIISQILLTPAFRKWVRLSTEKLWGLARVVNCKTGCELFFFCSAHYVLKYQFTLSSVCFSWPERSKS